MKTGLKIGKKIKTFREFKNVSQSELAENSGIDVSRIKQIEEKGKLPTLGHLIKLSRALGVRIGTFLDDQEQFGPVIVRKGNHVSSFSFSTNNDKNREHLNFYSLAQQKAGRNMEPFVVEIEPTKESDYKLSSHEGEEFIFVLEGSIEINYGKEIYQLSEGDSIYIDSVVAHNVHAAKAEKAKIIAVIYYPS